MRKLICGILAIALICPLGVAGFTSESVHAASKDSVTKKLEKEVTQEQKYKDGEVIVLLKGSLATSKAKAAGAMAMGKDITISELWQFDRVPQAKAKAASAKDFEDRSVVLVKSENKTTKQLIAELKQNKNVIKAEPNYICKASALTNDPLLDQQWPLKNAGQNNGTAGADIGVQTLWDQGKTGTQKVVAVIDTGVDYNHEDLAANIWENPYQAKLAGEHGFDFSNYDADPIDDNGHGTHCAGIIGGAGNNNTGITGINQTVKIMSLKFLDANGDGYLSDAVAAYSYINKALNLNVPVVAINNSWSGPDDGESQILAEVMNTVGAKGAISVCSAGNERTDNDAVSTIPIPANIESDYNLSVAATNEKNELATFSNYGKNTVDLAAPGADILSTVSYNSFNPSTYEGRIDQLCSSFANFDEANSNDITWGVPEVSGIYADGTADTNITVDDSEYFGNDGKSLTIKVKDAELYDFVSVELPYEVGVTSEAPEISAMVKVKGPKPTETEEFFGMELPVPSFFNIADIPATKSIHDRSTLEQQNYAYAEVDGEANYWEHLTLTSRIKKNASAAQQRKLVFAIECNSSDSEDYVINIDDLGISKENVSADQFGKYDFYNGTSMAAPHVTGAAALMRETAQDSMTADEMTAQIMSATKSESALDGKLVSGGVLDISKSNMPAIPRISSATVSTSANTITLKGTGFASGTTVKMGATSVPASSIKITSSKQMVIKNSGWINQRLDITVANQTGSSVKQNVYLVNGKTMYGKMPYMSFDGNTNVLGTNGASLYIADSSSDSLQQYVAEEEDFYAKAKVNYQAIFRPEKSNVERDFQFGPDLAYLDKSMYNIGVLREGIPSEEGTEEDDYEDYNSKAGGVITEDVLEIEPVPYAADYKLLRMSLSTGKAAALNMPAEYANITNQTIASYNGKLYMIGGYDYSTSKKELTTLVKVYDPVKGTWNNGPKLPMGRASGKALQVGNKLVYTLGYTAGTSCPQNLIFDGKTWRISNSTIAPYVSTKSQVQGNEYTLYTGSVGLCKDGLLYSGMPTKSLGDTFTYSISKDSFSATRFNFIKNIDAEGFNGTVIGSTIYGFDHYGQMHRLTAFSSGLVKVTASRTKGTVKGANIRYLPGEKVTLTVVPKKGYLLKTFSLSGKKIKGNKTTIRLTADLNASVSYGNAVKKITLNKKKVTLRAGKSFKLTVKITPKTAMNKQVTYKSSNNKYATVSAKGTIKAKKAGIGKTVTITVTAKDGSKVKAQCKVKIKR